MPLRLVSKKRPNYFTGQLLGQEDFLEEQSYHLSVERGHAQLLHTWGVVMGFEIARTDESTVVVRPGTALDTLGRLIVLDTAQNLTLRPAAPDAAVFITAAYDESFEDTDRSTDKAENYTRLSEFCLLNETTEIPADDGSLLVLGKVQFSSGKISGVDTTIRHEAGARLARESVGSAQIAPGAVTLSRLSADLRGGWVRMPFKPSSFVDPKQANQTQASTRDFTIGVTKTYCDDRGAKGTMTIPMPVLADRIVAFLIAGESNEAQLSIELDLCGWDMQHNVHEKTALVETQIAAKSPFNQSFTINKAFDRTRHALALYVAAAGAASISLVAVQFDSSLGQ